MRTAGGMGSKWKWKWKMILRPGPQHGRIAEKSAHTESQPHSHTTKSRIPLIDASTHRTTATPCTTHPLFVRWIDRPAASAKPGSSLLLYPAVAIAEALAAAPWPRGEPHHTQPGTALPDDAQCG